MKVHVKKCHPEQFRAIVDGRKGFEWRAEDDCRYAVGDVLLLLEYLPAPVTHGPPRNEGYTGDVCRVRVTYVLRGEFGVPDGYAVLSIEHINAPIGRGIASGPDTLAKQMEVAGLRSK